MNTYKRKVSVRAICVNSSGELLCFKLKAYGGRPATEYWCTPGGGVEPGEDLLSALNREMIEETGVKPVIGNLLYVQQFYLNDKEHLEFFFHIKNFQNYTNIDLSSTTHGAAEISELAFVKPHSSYVEPRFLSNQVFSNLEDATPRIFTYLSKS